MQIDLVSLLGVGVAVVAVSVTIVLALMKHIDARFDKLEKAQDAIDQKAENIRTEVYQEFVRRSDYKSIQEDIRKLFGRVEQMSGLLHELLGRMKRDTDGH